jgi:hypothetical protein
VFAAGSLAFGQGSIEHSLVPVDNTSGNGDPASGGFSSETHFTVDLVAEVVNDDWTATGGSRGHPDGILATIDNGLFYEYPALGGGAQPDPAVFPSFPALAYDSFYTTPEGWPNVSGQGRVPSFARMIRDPQLRRTTWFATPPGAGPGTYTLARFTVELNPGQTATFRAQGASILAGAPGLTEFDESIVVPEPGTLTLLAFAGLLVLRRR